MPTTTSGINRSKQVFKTLLTLILASLAFSFFAFHNRYPLMNSDSGAYINNGFHLNEVPADRPILYSLFIRFFSGSTSLWLPVVAQSFVLSIAVYQLFDFFFKDLPRKVFLAFVGSIVLFTNVGWFSGQLMPDIFTAILAISTVNFLLNEKWKAVNSLIILVSALMHNSNLITLLCSSIILLAISFSKKFEMISIKKSLQLLCISILSWLMICSYHAATGYGFRPSRGAHVFLIGKLCENGILKSYLDEACPTTNYKLCNYRDQLPAVAWDFIWTADGPFQKTGGWDSSAKEYNEIIHGTLTRPKFLGMHLVKSAEATVVQASQIDVGLDFGPLLENSNPYWKINDHFQHEMPQYRSSRQNSSSINIKTYDQLYGFFFALSTIAALLLAFYLPDNRTVFTIYIVCALMVLCNAFSTGTFANILPRLNSRLIWIIPMLNTLFIAQAIRSRFLHERNRPT